MLSIIATVFLISDMTFAIAPATNQLNFDSSVRAFLNDELADPDSAKIKEVRAPRWGKFIPVKTPWSKPQAAWLVCYSINAKNLYGAYTGYENFLFILDAGGRVKTYYKQNDFQLPSGNRVRNECNNPPVNE